MVHVDPPYTLFGLLFWFVSFVSLVRLSVWLTDVLRCCVLFVCWEVVCGFPRRGWAAGLLFVSLVLSCTLV